MKSKEIVKQYYKLVDNSKINELLELFSEDSVYVRCEKEIKGIENLEKFYRFERKISRKHKISEIVCEGIRGQLGRFRLKSR